MIRKGDVFVGVILLFNLLWLTATIFLTHNIEMNSSDRFLILGLINLPSMTGFIWCGIAWQDSWNWKENMKEEVF